MLGESIPNGDKCEWRTLQYLAQEFNKINHTQYELVECVDVKNRSDAVPEVRLKNKADSSYMVIEQKSIIWPFDKALRTGKFLKVANRIENELQNECKDAAYQLNFANEIEDEGKKWREISTEIVNVVKKEISNIDEGKTVSCDKIIPWQFRRDFSNKKWKGIAIIEHGKTFDHDSSKYEKMYRELEKMTEEMLIKSVEKFKKYENDLKIVALSYYVELYIDEDGIKAILEKIKVPKLIDQIWIEDEEWINEDNKIPKFICIYEKMIDKND